MFQHLKKRFIRSVLFKIHGSDIIVILSFHFNASESHAVLLPETCIITKTYQLNRGGELKVVLITDQLRLHRGIRFDQDALLPRLRKLLEIPCLLIEIARFSGKSDLFFFQIPEKESGIFRVGRRKITCIPVLRLFKGDQ